MWSETYGGASTDVANTMIRTKDGGYLIGGNVESFGLASAALMIIKTDSAGLSPPDASNPETSAWVPQPVSAVAASVAAVLVTGGVSIIFAATLAAPTSLGGNILQKIRDLIPNSFKEWLEAFMKSKRKLTVEEKTGSPFLPTRSEAMVYVFSILVLGLSFSYVKVNTFSQIVLVLPTILGTSILVGFVKTYILTVYSRMRGVWTEQKLWLLGLSTFIVTTFVFKVPFSLPCRSVHYEPKLTERLEVILSLAEVFITLAFAGCFYLLFLSSFTVVGSVGLAMCIIGAFFDTFPIAPMNGRVIYDYSKPLWTALFLATLALYVSWLLLL
jgi:hypothetical protein